MDAITYSCSKCNVDSPCICCQKRATYHKVWRYGWIIDMTLYSDVTWCQGDSSHRQHYCLIDSLFMLITKKALKLRITGTFRGKYIGDRLPSQSASNRESVSMSWRRYVLRSGDYAICANPLFIGIYDKFAVVYDRPICSITPAEVGLRYKIFILSSKHPSLLKHGLYHQPIRSQV